MKIIRCRFLVSCLMLALTTYGCSTVRQGGPEASDTGEGVEAATSTSDRFQLSDGDRVVFLGNSLFEEDLRYGLLEYTLATRFSDREVTFRNLGWSGDTVFGESRGYFTTPPDAYGHLIKQLTESEPTTVFIAYGAIESLEGEVGIPRFREGLESLLDTIDELGAEAVLLSPVPHFQKGSPVKDLDAYHEQLISYSDVLSETALDRDLLFIDLFEPLLELGEEVALSDNGVHLNETGYTCLATELERALGFPDRENAIAIDLNGSGDPPGSDGAGGSSGASGSGGSGNTGETASWSYSDFSRTGGMLTVQLAHLPLPSQLYTSDKRSSSPGEYSEQEMVEYQLKIQGLDEGTWSLGIDGYRLVGASAEEWENGVVVQVERDQDIWTGQATRLRELIVRKNDLYFQKYRPPNRTYLTGFRSYEQGQNAVELEELGRHVVRLEEQISGLRTPRPVRLSMRKIN